MERIDWPLVCRWIMTAMGGVLAAVKPTLPYILICTLAILADCFTAWQLSKRVRKAHPERTTADSGKFNSRHAGHVLITLIKAYSLIILAHFVSIYIVDCFNIDLAKLAAGCICFWQMWSILENEASCNGAKWARLAQKIFVDKTERHLDLDLSELKKEDDGKL